MRRCWRLERWRSCPLTDSSIASAIVVLGMHRSGTSCLAGMLAAGGLASAGQAVRNWDNARGHHEMLDLVRLDEAVLAHSGGHYLAPPAEVRWTDAHAAERDRLLRASIDGKPALLKDPRMLLVLPFWRASSVPFRAIGIVRHPLAVARSLESWRGMPLVEGVALWTAHARALLEDRAQHGYPVVDFDAPRDAMIDAVAAFAGGERERLAAAYEAQLVHHDAGEAPAIAGLDDALALHRQLVGEAVAVRPAFPRALVDAGMHGDLEAARAALATVDDAAAVLVPIVTALVRQRAFERARSLIDETAPRIDEGLAHLLRAKATEHAAAALPHLEAACAVASPLFQAKQLLPQALRAAGRPAEARVALRSLATAALYPHGPLSTLAEWSWLDGDREGALAEMAEAIEAAPLHRRGRLRTRRAEWLLARGDVDAARAELERAIVEDPGYRRSRDVLESIE